jgi:hypothetical protein
MIIQLLLKLSPEMRMRVHATAIDIWGVLCIGTTIFAIFFPDSPYLFPWLIFISCYALVVGHWASYEGAAPSAEEIP